MKRYFLVLTSVITILLSAILVAGLVGAEPQFPVSNLTMTICSRGVPEKMWFDEQTGHGRNMLQNWVMESADRRFVGYGSDVVNWNLNLVELKGVSWGSYVLYNDNGKDGWSGQWQGKLSPTSIMTAENMPIWLFDGRGEGHGFGMYHGLQEHFDVHQSVLVYPTDGDVPAEIPCVTGATLDGQVYILQNHIPAYVTGRAED